MSYLAERGLENGKPSSKGEGGGKETFQVENSSAPFVWKLEIERGMGEVYP